MKKLKTKIEGSFLIEIKKFEDERGFFMETWNHKEFNLPIFVQDNYSQSKKGVLRGLHYQLQPMDQGKLLRCTKGAVFDVTVDLREDSSSFGKWFGIELNRPEQAIWIPPGIAHGFYTLSESADIQYKVTKYYDPASERVLLWNDPALRIQWPIDEPPRICKRDINEAKTFKLSPKHKFKA